MANLEETRFGILNGRETQLLLLQPYKVVYQKVPNTSTKKKLKKSKILNFTVKKFQIY